MNTKYLDKFKRLTPEAVSGYKLHGGRVLVEILPKEEVKTAGGLIMAAPTNYAKGATFETQTGTKGVVLMVGEGYVDSEGKQYDVSVKVGNVVLVNDFGVRALSSFPGLQEYTALSLAIIDETAIQMSWENIEAFEQYSKVLNEGL